MKTEEKNRLIAEFMQLACQHRDNEKKYPLFESPESGEYIEPENLKYDESWDWLMPVVETCYHNGAEEGGVGDITHALLDVNIEAVWNAVVEFIQWYNQNKK